MALCNAGIISSKMSQRKDTVASGAARQGSSNGRTDAGSACLHPAKPTELLNELEFKECFNIPNDVSVQLVEGGVISTEKAEDNSIYFTKEQFNAGLRLPLPFLFQQFLHYTRIPSALLYPNVIRVLMGCSILDMLFRVDLSLLKVLFVYTIKKGKHDIFSLFTNIPFLQLVTDIPNSIKGAA